MMYTVMGDNNA